MEEERDTCIDEEEREYRSPVRRTQAGYVLVDERWKRMDKVTSGEDKRARIEEEVLEVWMSACNQEKRTTRKAVAFSK